MDAGDFFVLMAVTLVSLSGTALMIWLAPRIGAIDVPNPRSSHRQPTPRAGGVAIVVAVCVGLAIWWWQGRVPAKLASAVLIGGLPIALVGLIDDRWSLSPWLRLAVQIAAIVLAIHVLGVPDEVKIGAFTVRLFPWALFVAVLGCAWLVNLFNFMDGIDGIAAAEAIFIGGAAALILLSSGSTGESAAGVRLTLLLATGCLGFLVWNWSPARIFMGDVGSAFLGFFVAILAVATAMEGSLTVWTWMILSSLFVADATVTLLRRIMRGDRWHEAHRSHAYQQLTRRWNSHARVTVSFVCVNCLIVLPLAWASALIPEIASWLATGTLAAAFLAAWFLKAGVAERAA